MEQSVLPSREEEQAVKLLENSLTRSDDDQRYQIATPWKQDPISLPVNREMAIKRLLSTEKSLEKRGLKQDYVNILDDHRKKGYIRPVDPTGEPSKNYLPHFPVVRPNATSTKMRIVFDASAEFNGTSLNQYVHKGPKLQRELVDVLLRFRQAPVAIA